MDRSARQGVLLRRIRAMTAFFIVALVGAGLTAIPIEWESDLMARAVGLAPGADPGTCAGVLHWVALARQGIHETAARYPFMAYGFDWLAFSHVLLGILFIGVWRDPVRNSWIVTFGMMACVLVFPTALGFGHVRGIPWFWQLIDCSFGVFGFIPLWLVRRYTLELQAVGGAD